MDRRVDSNSVRGREIDYSTNGRSRYIDEVWILHDPVGETYDLDFNTRFGEIKSWQKQVAKNFVYSRCSEIDGKFVRGNKASSWRGEISHLATIFRILNEKYPGRVLSDLSEEDLAAVAIYNVDGPLSSYHSSAQKVRILSSLSDMKLGGKCFVPEAFLPSCDIRNSWGKIAARHVEMSGKNFPDWRAGGSFDIVPFEVSLALLAYCINLIQSDETKYILAWYQVERKWFGANGGHPAKVSVERVLSNFGGTYYSNAHSAKALDEAFFNELRLFYPYAEAHDQLPLRSVPFSVRKSGDQGSLIEKADHLLVTCLVAILILTGIRHSEATSMESDAIQNNGSFHTYTSSIKKTNYGVKTDRDVANIAGDFFDILDGLGSFGLADERRPDLFSYVRYHYSHKKHSLLSFASRGIAPKKLKVFYDRFLETQEDDMREHCPHVTPHGFRHTWAEFAMRRFDGNIMPLIRDHYRHHFGSSMTGVYTHNKIELSEYQELGKRQIFELVSRYIDGAAALYGQLGEFLTARVGEIKFIEMHDRQERDAAIKRIIDEDVGDPIITPHEYGLCVLREHTKSLANCRDENGIPQTETADISNCAGCVNSCMVKQLDGKEDTHPVELQRQLEAYKRQAETWQDDELLGPLFLDEARKTFRAIQAIKTKMEAANE